MNKELFELLAEAPAPQFSVSCNVNEIPSKLAGIIKLMGEQYEAIAEDQEENFNRENT